MAPSLRELTARANELKAAGRFAEAIAAHQEIARIAPGNGAVLHNLAAALGDAGRNAEAADVARRALATGLDAPETWLVLARALAGAEALEEAERAFRKAIERRPADASAHRDLAQLIWMKTGDASAAVSTLDQAIGKFPEIVELRLARAYVRGQCGDPQAEYAEVLDALSRSGGAPRVELTAANAAIAAGNYEAGLNHARQAMRFLSGERGVRQALCRALLAVGEAQEASEVAAGLHEEFPLDQHSIALLATAWRILGDERYYALYDYDAFVMAGELEAPEGWPDRQSYLADLVEALDRHHQYASHPFSQSVRHGSQLPSINMIDEPPLKAYAQAIAGPLYRYMEKVGRGSDPLRSRNNGTFQLFSAWSVRLPASGFHIDHVHPEGWLSSACHLRLPETDDADRRAGWLKFGEPGIPTTPKLAPEKFVEPKEGVLVVFPSYMWHGTVPFQGKRSRLTVAVDLTPAI